jgi:hypothetical protein
MKKYITDNSSKSHIGDICDILVVGAGFARPSRDNHTDDVDVGAKNLLPSRRTDCDDKQIAFGTFETFGILEPIATIINHNNYTNHSSDNDA